MGLTLGVGWFARQMTEGEDVQPLQEAFFSLNEVLREAGMSAHHEPLDLEATDIFEAQMWGYGGLHAVRRLAAYQACEGTLPPPAAYEDYADDPVVEQLNGELGRAYYERRGGRIRRWLTSRRSQPKFEHLLWHSDCEGFYLPRDFEHVVLDYAQPQREGVGGMVGSSVRLLSECKELAQIIGHRIVRTNGEAKNSGAEKSAVSERNPNAPEYLQPLLSCFRRRSAAEVRPFQRGTPGGGDFSVS